jgi:hypothetical protein
MNKMLVLALASVSLLLSACGRQSDQKSEHGPSGGGNNAIIKKVVILAEVPIDSSELEQGTYSSKISEAYQKARLLLADYSGRTPAGLEQDVLDLFQLERERAAERRNVIFLGKIQSRDAYEGRKNASNDALLDEVKQKRDALDQKFSAKTSEILSKYGN